MARNTADIPTPTPDAILKARGEADKLAHLLREEWPDGDEIKDALFAVGMAIKRALPAIRELEGTLTSKERPSVAGVG